METVLEAKIIGREHMVEDIDKLSDVHAGTFFFSILIVLVLSFAP